MQGGGKDLCLRRSLTHSTMNGHRKKWLAKQAFPKIMHHLHLPNRAEMLFCRFASHRTAAVCTIIATTRLLPYCSRPQMVLFLFERHVPPSHYSPIAAVNCLKSHRKCKRRTLNVNTSPNGNFPRNVANNYAAKWREKKQIFMKYSWTTIVFTVDCNIIVTVSW